MSDEPILEVRDLVKHFQVGGGLLRQPAPASSRRWTASSFAIRRGETLGSSASPAAARRPRAAASCSSSGRPAGRCIFEGGDLTELATPSCAACAGAIQVIFQDPYSSLNPRMTVGQIIAEPLAVHGIVPDRAARRARVAELLAAVGLLPEPWPGATRTSCRAASASASASPGRSPWSPRLIICDEPVSALDVSIQAQIINLLEELQAEFGLTYLFIAHDLSVVRHISDRVAVMYLGKIVEITDRKSLYEDPRHPYTQALLSAVPIPDPAVEAGREHGGPGRARCRARSTRPRAASSTPAAPSRWTNAADHVPELREIKPGHQRGLHPAVARAPRLDTERGGRPLQ